MATDPYDIRNHVDYQNHMKDYIKRSDCNKIIQKVIADNNKLVEEKMGDAKVLELKNKCKEIVEQNKSLRATIANHQQQVTVLKSHMDNKCKEIVEQNKSLRASIISHQQTVSTLKSQINTKQSMNEETIANIKKGVLEQYAVKDMSTCPPTYIPCKQGKKCESVEIHPKYKALLETVAELKERLGKVSDVSKSLSQSEQDLKKKMRLRIQDHPDYPNMVNYYELQITNAKKCTDISKQCPPQRECVDPRQSVAYNTLAEKYRKCMSLSQEEHNEYRSGEEIVMSHVANTREPRAIKYSDVPMLNPAGAIKGTGMYEYDPYQLGGK